MSPVFPRVGIARGDSWSFEVVLVVGLNPHPKFRKMRNLEWGAPVGCYPVSPELGLIEVDSQSWVTRAVAGSPLKRRERAAEEKQNV